MSEQSSFFSVYHLIRVEKNAFGGTIASMMSKVLRSLNGAQYSRKKRALRKAERRRRMTCLKGSNEGKCRRICIDRREVLRGQRNQITQRPLTWCAACEVWPKTGTPSPGWKGVSLFRGCKLGLASCACVRVRGKHNTRYMQLPLLAHLTLPACLFGVTIVVASLTGDNVVMQP